MSQRYHLIRVGTIWFTSNGTETGTRCKTLVNGIDSAILDYSGQTIIAASGKAWTQLVDFAQKQGTVFGFQFEDILVTKHQAIVDLMNSTLEGQTNVQLALTGNFTNITTNIKPLLPGAIVSPNGAFRGDFVKQVTYNFIVDI